MKIEGAYFDLDDVVYDTTNFSTNSRLSGIKVMQTHYFPEMPLGEFEKSMNYVLSKKVKEPRQFFNNVLKNLGIREDDPRFYLAVAHARKSYHDRKYDANEFHPYLETRPFLLELSKRGVKLGVITNGDPMNQYDKIVRLNLTDFFSPNHIIVSGAVKVFKPEKEIYEIGIERMGLSSSDIVFFDDRIENVQGAMDVGMLGVHVLRGKHAGKRGNPNHEVHNLSEFLELLD